MTKENQFMNAIEVQNPGENSTLALMQRGIPTPKNGQVLIRVHAAGINRPDLLQRAGNYPPPDGASDILGLEVAGEIVDGPRKGEAVCALLAGGGYAEYTLADEALCLPIPKNLSFEQAAALPECISTVWNNVFVLGEFKAGETTLIHGGTSGIGSFAIQMIKSMGGKTIVTCGSDDKCEAALRIGADKAVNYKTEDFVEEALSFTDGKGVHLVLDMVGGDYVARNIDALREYGRHVSIAFLGGAKASIIIPKLMRKRATLTGSVLRSRPLPEKAAIAKDLRKHIWPKIEAGAITPYIHKIFNLKDADKAHAVMQNSDHVGKIVLKV